MERSEKLKSKQVEKLTPEKIITSEKIINRVNKFFDEVKDNPDYTIKESGPEEYQTKEAFNKNGDLVAEFTEKSIPGARDYYLHCTFAGELFHGDGTRVVLTVVREKRDVEDISLSLTRGVKDISVEEAEEIAREYEL